MRNCAHCPSQYPCPAAYPPRKVFPPYSSARGNRPAAATAGTSCSKTSASFALDSSNRRQQRERERERERRSGSALSQPSDGRRVRASAEYGLLARAAVKKAAARRIKAQRSRAHTPDRQLLSFCRLPPCRVRCECSAPSMVAKSLQKNKL